MLSNRITYALIILIFIIVIILCLYLFNNEESIEGYENLGTTFSAKWNSNKCKHPFGDVYDNLFNSHAITKDEQNWNLYLPCNYDNIEKEVSEMPVVNGAKYFIIDGVDSFVAKNTLWGNMVKHYGDAKAKTIMPQSYELYIDDDIIKLMKEFNKNKIYIMKKNIQRQEGLKITNDLNEIIKGKDFGYAVVQELLQNPYIIDERKTNMRFYVLIVCKNRKINIFVYNDGFMYYTKVPFAKNSLDTDVNITTGYINRSVYATNPLTHTDLKVYLDDPDRKLSKIETNIRNQGLKLSQVCFQRIYNLLRDVFVAFIGHMAKNKKFNNTTNFQLFGVDVAVDDELNPMIMEINKGPDLGAKDERDKKLKAGVVQNTFSIIGVIPQEKENNFIHLLES